MQVQKRGRTGRAVMPIVGSAAAVAAGGALATVAEAAPAVPDIGDGTLGALGGVPGTFESCEAYFGFGKELVAFDVVDQNGADGAAHAVPTDTQVVFVLENEAGDQIECTPVELTEEEWDEFIGDTPIPGLPTFPGPGHFVYPSIEQGAFIDDEFGEAVSVGFRVVGVPGGHTLVSPTGTVELLQSQLDGEDLLFLQITDPRIAAHIATGASAAAAEAWEDAVADCVDEFATPLGGDDLAAAFAVLEALTGDDVGDLDCGDVHDQNLDASIVLGLQESIANTETITLALPVQATTTTTTATTIASTTTTVRVLARTGPGGSASVPVALVGVAGIAGGALVLAARRRLHGSR